MFDEEFLKVFENIDVDGEDAQSDNVRSGEVDGTAALAPSYDDYEDEGESDSLDETDNNGMFPIDDGEPFNGGESRIDVVYDPATGYKKVVEEKMYSVKYASKKLRISHQTVRNYAYEISEYLQGGRTADGNLLFTISDIELIGNVYDYCRVKGIKKTDVKAYYFKDKKNTSVNNKNNEAAQITDIKDKFLECMYEKMDRLSDVMLKLSDHLDNSVRVISSFENKLDEQGKAIDSIKAELEADRNERKKTNALIKSRNDYIKQYINEEVNKAKDEVISAVSNSSVEMADESGLVKTVEDTRNTVRGLVKIISRIDTRVSQGSPLTKESLEKMIGGAGRSDSEETERLSAENAKLKKEIQELKEQNALMKNSFMMNSSTDDIENLLKENEELKDRAINAEKTVNDMALRIRSLESLSDSNGDDTAGENAVLKKKLSDAYTAFRNMSEYVRKLESERKDVATDNGGNNRLNVENNKLKVELASAKETMKKMAERISVLESASDDDVLDSAELKMENEVLASELTKTRTAFYNISKRLKEVEANVQSSPSDDIYEELIDDNARLKVALSSAKKKIEELEATVSVDIEEEKPQRHKKRVSDEPKAKVKEKKSLFSKKLRKTEPADLLPVNVIPDEEQLRMERNASKIDISPVMPDIDEEYLDNNDTEEWHDDIEELPDGLFGFDDVDESLGDIDIDGAIDRRAKQIAKDEKKKADKEKKKKKKFLRLF